MINILNNLHQILSYYQNSINKIRSFNFPNQFYSSRFIFIHSKTKILQKFIIGRNEIIPTRAICVIRI